MQATPFSIIIPACNEEAVIARCLRALTTSAEDGELEIVVVCNGCTDRTAEVARAFGEPVTVIETAIPSKTTALNLGDAAAIGWPRLYVDADIVLSVESARQLVHRLLDGDDIAVAPQVHRNMDECSWAVRAYYDIDSRLPSSKHGIGGSGVYGLSETARMRFGRFPEITADDEFVRWHFSVQDRECVPGASSTVYPPRRLSVLVAIMTRSHFGNAELKNLRPDLCKNNPSQNLPAIVDLAKNPRLWLKLAVYGYVKIISRFRGKQRLRDSSLRHWDRDDTSRQPAKPNRIATVRSEANKQLETV